MRRRNVYEISGFRGHHSIDWQLVADISEQLIGSIFKDHAVQDSQAS